MLPVGSGETGNELEGNLLMGDPKVMRTCCTLGLQNTGDQERFFPAMGISYSFIKRNTLL